MRWFRPKWVIRRIFQAFFLSILSILVLVGVLAYVYSLLPTITPVVPVKNYTFIRLISLDIAPRKYLSSNLATTSQETVDAAQISSSTLSSLSKPELINSNNNIITKDKNNKNKYNNVQSSGGQDPKTKARESLAINNHESAGGSVVSGSSIKARSTDRCSIFTCFDIYRCGNLGQDTLSVYIYPIEKIFVDGRPVQNSLSKEFYQFIDAIRNSPFYVPDPNKACIFVPTIDLMNLHLISPLISANDIKLALSNLEFWGEAGENHLLFNLFPGSFPLTSISDAAIVASTEFSYESYRPGFHIPLISYNPILQGEQRHNSNSTSSNSNNHSILGRKILAVSAQGFVKREQIEDDDILVLDFCSHQPLSYTIRCKGNQIFFYPEILRKTDFCIVLKDVAHPTLWDVMSVGCIPVIVLDSQRLPFDDLIDWRRNAILMYENQLHELSSILRNVSPERKRRLKSQVLLTFKKYFKSVYHITNTVLEVIKNRIFVHTAAPIQQWNQNPENMVRRSPIFNPMIAPKTPGFTAVILAYDRMPSLIQVIERVASVPSLAKILVVWNNQMKKPPGALAWPKISKPLKIIQTSANKMSNRFYPYEEIETEAVFALDDDIIMLNVDEIEFGFESWREFPDRIVGFPSRSHVWDNSSQRWKYESEWTNEISMVLTGAAFYHKFWHHAYTYELPGDIREWVDAKMNCEDIAMNFLVSHHTGKAPIKVTPRKKFKCPTCLNNEMLSTDSGHMVERTDCINRFAQIYGSMPLLPVEFRADPVLFKVDSLPSKLKRFNDVGSL